MFVRSLSPCVFPLMATASRMAFLAISHPCAKVLANFTTKVKKVDKEEQLQRVLQRFKDYKLQTSKGSTKVRDSKHKATGEGAAPRYPSRPPRSERNIGPYLASQIENGRFIETTAALQKLCDKIRAKGRFAIDTEFHLDGTYFIELALVQIGIDGQAYCIDPLAKGIDLSCLDELMCDSSVQKVVHAAAMDLRVFYERTGKPSQNILDTQIAAGLLGHGIAAYADLVEMACNVKLSKGATMSDWIRRPLSDEQVKYAEDDVAYLEQVADYFLAELKGMDRLEWLFEETLKYNEDAFYKPTLEDNFRRLKKVRSLTAEQAVKAFRILEWRESAAQKRNRPAPTVLRNDVIAELAKLNAVDSLAKLQEEGSRILHPRLVEHHGDELVKILTSPTDGDLERIKAILDDQEQVASKKEKARANAVYSLAYSYYLAVCAQQDLEPTAVTSSMRLRDLVVEAVNGKLDYASIGPEGFKPSQNLAPHHIVLSGWRYRLIGKKLLQFLQGKVYVKLDPAGCVPIFVET